MSRPPLLALALTLALAGLAPTPSFADLFSLNVDRYDSPTFVDSSNFSLKGLNSSSDSVDLTLGIGQDVTLDRGHAAGGPRLPFGNPFTGTATSNITLGGITESISYSYSFDDTFPGSLTLTGGSPIVFDFGTSEVTVTPTDSTDFARHATFLETATAAVPEPSSLWVAAVGGAAFAGYGLRRARRARAAA
jgi:hypothetical protein